CEPATGQTPRGARWREEAKTHRPSRLPELADEGQVVFVPGRVSDPRATTDRHVHRRRVRDVAAVDIRVVLPVRVPNANGVADVAAAVAVASGEREVILG